ncbi:stage III sporulation protein AF [Sutcliffiella cohnii]|uniref:stage III sporulation protein AF n=1 Tax=Sutcliffiella cohnii TaxID=33932 RepID=UPI002E2135C0|nr:stage III sporulation protein AF [Sutcliffiella cohnii]
MSYLTEWITSIILFILLATVIDMLLPNSSMQKYTKLVIGLLLIVIILTPIFKLLSTDMDELFASFSDHPSIISEKNLKNSTELKKREIQASSRAYKLEQMAVQLKDLVEEELMEQYGLIVEDIDLDMKEDPVNHTEDEIEHIAIYLVEKDSVTAIREVEPVSIDTSKPIERPKPAKETENVQSFLSEQWQIQSTQITVVMEGGKR